MPAVPGAAFVVVEAKFALCGLEALLNTPARAFDTNQYFDRGALGASRGEVGEFAIGEAAPDQQAARPGAWSRQVVFSGAKVSQRAVDPIV